MKTKFFSLIFILSIITNATCGICASKKNISDKLKIKHIIYPYDPIVLTSIELFCEGRLILNEKKGQYRIIFDNSNEEEKPLIFRYKPPNFNTAVPKGGSFQDHISRSNSPGIDIDITYLETEDLKLKSNCVIPWYYLKPAIHSTVSGEVIIPYPQTDGTVIIKDKNGYFHTFLHNQMQDIVIPYKDKRTVTTNLIAGVNKGQVIAYLGNTSSKRDHLHYFIHKRIYKNCVEYVDPLGVLFDIETGAVTNPSPDNSCISCKRELIIENVCAYKPVSAPNRTAKSSITISGKISIINTDKKLCSKSIIRKIKWDYKKKKGNATTKNNWKTWSANISPLPEPGEVITFTSYGLKGKQLNQITYKLEPTLISLCSSCCYEEATKDSKLHTKTWIWGTLNYVFDSEHQNRSPKIEIESIDWSYNNGNKQEIGNGITYNGKSWWASIPATINKEMSINVELTIKVGEKEFKKTLKLNRCLDISRPGPPTGFCIRIN